MAGKNTSDREKKWSTFAVVLSTVVALILGIFSNFVTWTVAKNSFKNEALSELYVIKVETALRYRNDLITLQRLVDNAVVDSSEISLLGENYSSMDSASQDLENEERGVVPPDSSGRSIQLASDSSINIGPLQISAVTVTHLTDSLLLTLERDNIYLPEQSEKLIQKMLKDPWSPGWEQLFGDFTDRIREGYFLEMMMASDSSQTSFRYDPVDSMYAAWQPYEASSWGSFWVESIPGSVLIRPGLHGFVLVGDSLNTWGSSLSVMSIPPNVQNSVDQ